MSRGLPLALALGLGLAAGGAQACGVCVEDAVAATYDHAVVQRASARGQVVVYGRLAGAAPGNALASAARRAAARIAGIDPASIRTAPEPAALSFALDATRLAPDAALTHIARDAGAPGLQVTLLRVAR